MADSVAQVPIQKLVNLVYDFCELYGDRHLFPYQEQFARRLIRSVLLNDGAEITALFSRQSGKCFAKDTEILMSDGTVKKVQDIKVGDFVMRPNGKPAKVLSLGRGKEEMFEVLPKDKGRHFIVNKSHILSLIDVNLESIKNVTVKDYISNKDVYKIYQGYRISKDFKNKIPFGFDLISKGTGEYYGFTIDADDHLFLLGDYTVTHNTETVALVTGGLMIFLPTLANLPMFANDSRLAPYKKGVMIGIYAPTLRQAQINYNRMRSFLTSDSAIQVLQDQDFRLDFDTNNGNTVRLSNGSYASAISASEGSNIEGESHHLIICEEAQDISDLKIQKSIHPMAAAYNGTFVLVGTATTQIGYFYRTIKRNKEEMKEKGIGTTKGGSLDRLHFEYDCDVAGRYNPKYRKYVEGEKRKLGEKSDSFLMSYKLQWMISRGMLVDIEQFERDNTEKHLDIVNCDLVATHVVGIDLGGAEGGDSTVLTAVEVNWDMPVVREKKFDEELGEEIEYVAYNTYIKSWLELQNMPDYEEQYYIIKDFISQFNTVRVVLDATREKGLSDRLAATLHCDVVPYVFTARSKSDLYLKFIGELSTARARIPFGLKTQETLECRKFLEQLGSMQKTYRGANLVCSHPDIRNAHDDYVDSWALAVWGASYEGNTFKVESHDKRALFKEFSRLKFYKKTNVLTARRR